MLMEEKEQEITEREDAMLEKADKVEKVLQQAARGALHRTRITRPMVSAPRQQPQYAEVHSAVAGGRGADRGGHRSRRQCDQE